MLSAAIILIVLIGVLMYFIIQKLPVVDGIRTILLGIAIIVLGGFFILDSDIKLGALKYLIAMFGFILTLTGFFKEDETPQDDENPTP